MDKWQGIYGCVSTYNTLSARGDIIVSFVEELYEQILKPLGKELNITIEGPRLRPKEGRFDREWEKLKAPILEGKMTHLFLHHWDSRLWHSTPELRITSKEHVDGSTSLIEFVLEKTLYQSGSIKERQYIFVELLEKLHINLQGVGGFLTIDQLVTGSASSPHERYNGLDYSNAARQFNRYYRGYFWGNFLNECHVELLGGVDRIARDAPVYKTKLMDDGGMFLQLTDDIENVTDNDLKKLKCFFLPILPPRLRDVNIRHYEKLRVITDDCTD